MSGLFISHSNRDEAAAEDLARRLEEQGYRSLFLDFDPARGIPAGRDWEKELYRQLRACQGVVVLCSEHSMASQWVFAEITHAKAMGKPLFPLKIGSCTVNPVLTSHQVLDLTTDEDPSVTYGRLWRGLEAAGLDPAGTFAWDPHRPPYPGLMAFQEADAGVFFGRDEEIRGGLELLGRLRRFGGPRAVMVLGASGSGKSSLVRAGLVPRLRLDPRSWLVVGPFRPRERPFQELAIALAEAFGDHGEERDRRVLEERFRQAAGAEPVDGTPLVEATLDLQRVAGAPDATLLLIVDQAEELLAHADGAPEASFLPFVQAALRPPDGHLVVVGTLRSDFLGRFQQHPATRDLAFEDLRVGPPSIDQWTRLIEGPAAKAGVDLEPGLTAAMVRDTETEDALPLLAFTLHELYDRGRGDGVLTLEEYRHELGGLEGSVARAAEAVFEAEPLTEERTRALREAFLDMVHLDEEGLFARKAARWTRLPERIHPVLERFVRARLLVSRGEGEDRFLEVAHEALFRHWDRLRRWLDEDRDFIRWRQRLDDACRQWRKAGRDPGLLFRGSALDAAERWLGERGARLDPEERALVEASLEERRRLERRRRRLVQTAVAVSVLFLVLGGSAVVQWRQAVTQRRLAVARQLATQARGVLDETGEGLERSLLLAVESLKEAWTPDGYAAWAEAVELLPRRSEPFVRPDGPVHALALHPTRPLLVTDEAGGFVVRDAVEGSVVESVDHPEGVRGLHMSPDGSLLAVVTDRALELWSTERWEREGRADLEDWPTEVAFSPDGGLVALGSRSERVRLFEAPALRELPPEASGPLDRSLAVAFAGSGDWMVVGGSAGIHVWPVAERGDTAREPASSPSETRGAGPRREADIHTGIPVVELAYVDDGEKLVVQVGQQIRAWPWSSVRGRGPGGAEPVAGSMLDSEEGAWLRRDPLYEVVIPGSTLGSRLTHSPRGSYLAYATREGVLRVVDVRSNEERFRLVLPDPPGPFAFRADGDALVVADDRGLARWSVEPGGAVRRLAAGRPVRSVAFSPDGVWLAAAVGALSDGVSPPGGTVRVFAVRDGSEVFRVDAASAERVLFSPDGGRMAAATSTSVRIYETRGWALSTTIDAGDIGPAPLVPDSLRFDPGTRWLAIRTVALTEPNQAGVRRHDLTYPSRTTIWDASTGNLAAWRSNEAQDTATAFVRNAVPEARQHFGQGGRTELLDEVGDWPHSRDPADPRRRWIFRVGDTSVALAEAETGRQVTALEAHAAVEDLTVAPDGTLLAAASDDGIRLWLLGPIEALVAEACARLSRNLRAGEWRTYRTGAPSPTCPGLPEDTT